MRTIHQIGVGLLLLSMAASSLAQAVGPGEIRASAIALEQAGRNAEAEEAWKQIADVHPSDPEAFAHLGLLEARQENYSAAITSYNRALELAPDMPSLEMNLGLAYFKAGQFPGALKAFSAELQRQPADSSTAKRLSLLLGMTHYGMGDYFVAIPYLQRAADEDQRNLPLRLTLAHSCLWSKQYDCVLKVDKEILALNPDSAEADMLVGEALDDKGDDAGAIAQFRAATLADSKQPNAHFGLGYLLWKLHHFDEAAVEFQAELVNDPTHQQARAYLGDSLVELTQLQKAQPELEKAAAEPSSTLVSAMVHRDLGIVYASAGRKDDAANELMKAIDLDPKDVAPHWRLGKLYQSLGRKDEAKMQFDTASSMLQQRDRPLAQEINQPGTQH